jgi:uncharacterized protein YqeY
MLLGKIRGAWIEARKDAMVRKSQKDIIKAALLGTLLGKCETIAKNFSPERPLTDDEVVAQIKKLIDGATETIGHLKVHGGSEDAIAKAQAEIDVLTLYMPQQLDEMAIEAFLRAKMAEGVVGVGPLMGALKAAHAGAYDGRVASAVAKRL